MTTRTVSQENKIRRRDRWGEMETRNVKTFRNFEAMVGSKTFFWNGRNTGKMDIYKNPEKYAKVISALHFIDEKNHFAAFIL